MRIQEHDRVVLRTPVPFEGPKAGDVGTIVHIHQGGLGYEVEFVGRDGHTVALRTLDRAPVRPLRSFLEGQSGGRTAPPAARRDG
jgi:hypothetical protein